MQGRQPGVRLGDQRAINRLGHVVAEQRRVERAVELARIGPERVAHHLGREHRAERALVFFPCPPEGVEHQLAVGATCRLAKFLERRVVQAHLGAGAQQDSRKRQLGRRQQAAHRVRLLQHVAGRGKDGFGLHAQRVRCGAQDVVELEAKACRERRFSGLERSHLVGAEGDDLRRQPRGLLADLRAQHLGALEPLLVDRDAQVLVALERGIGEEAAGVLADAADRIECGQQRRGARTERALVMFQLVDRRAGARIGVAPGLGRRVQVGQVPHRGGADGRRGRGRARDRGCDCQADEARKCSQRARSTQYQLEHRVLPRF